MATATLSTQVDLLARRAVVAKIPPSWRKTTRGNVYGYKASALTIECQPITAGMRPPISMHDRVPTYFGWDEGAHNR